MNIYADDLVIHSNCSNSFCDNLKKSYDKKIFLDIPESILFFEEDAINNNKMASEFSDRNSSSISRLAFEKTSSDLLKTSNITIVPDCKYEIHRLRMNNPSKILIGHLNFNSIRNKFEVFTTLLKGNLDIILLSETKIDDSFPTNQFLLDGYSTPYRLDRNCNGGGLLLYVREDIPSKKIKFVFPDPTFEGLFIEINLNKKKWLLGGSYNYHKSNISKHLESISLFLDNKVITYENILLIGDFNMEPNEEKMSEFMNIYNLKNLVNEKTCFKNPENPTCIDLLITNAPRSFNNTTVFETGLSDFHKLTVTVLRKSFQKLVPRVTNYRCYKNFASDTFKTAIYGELLKIDINNISYDHFVSIFMKVLNNQAPLKQKYIRANHSNFVTKELQKAIMKRSRLRNYFLRKRDELSKSAYKKQRNYCVNLLRKIKKKYYSNIGIKSVNDNRKFWKTVKPLFSDKITYSEKITLIENDRIVTDDLEIANIFNDYFSNIVTNLEINKDQNNLTDPGIRSDPLTSVIEKYNRHPSILSIRNVMAQSEEKVFEFSFVSKSEISDELVKLNKAKASPSNDVPVKIIKENLDLLGYFLYNNFNNSLFSCDFPNGMKLAEIKPIFKKDDKTNKENYRPISILPALSKVYEKLMYNQIYNYFESFFSKLQCGFRKGIGAQDCLLSMIEKWRLSLDKGDQAGGVLTDLSKAFDCIDHELLIAKLVAYGFSRNSIHFMYSYQDRRCQRAKINSSFSTWEEIHFGVPQGSILGPLLFNIFICDLFHEVKDIDINNYADDNTPYACASDISIIVSKLESGTNTLCKWFKENHLKFNADKCHLVTSSNEPVSVTISGLPVVNEKRVKLLGINIEGRLGFDFHVNKLCNKASKKLNALARICNYMNIDQKRKIMKAFITSQFSFCPLVWMFNSRNINNRINKIHHRALKLVYNNELNSSFENLLEKDASVSIHQKNLQYLAIEIFKAKNDISSSLMKEMFIFVNKPYDLRNNTVLSRRKIKTEFYGTETISNLAPKIWDLVPSSLKEAKSLNIFKREIKKYKFHKCPCKLCKTYISNLGYI